MEEQSGPTKQSVAHIGMLRSQDFSLMTSALLAKSSASSSRPLLSSSSSANCRRTAATSRVSTGGRTSWMSRQLLKTGSASQSHVCLFTPIRRLSLFTDLLIPPGVAYIALDCGLLGDQWNWLIKACCASHNLREQFQATGCDGCCGPQLFFHSIAAGLLGLIIPAVTHGCCKCGGNEASMRPIPTTNSHIPGTVQLDWHLSMVTGTTLVIDLTSPSQ